MSSTLTVAMRIGSPVSLTTSAMSTFSSVGSEFTPSGNAACMNSSVSGSSLTSAWKDTVPPMSLVMVRWSLTFSAPFSSYLRFGGLDRRPVQLVRVGVLLVDLQLLEALGGLRVEVDQQRRLARRQALQHAEHVTLAEAVDQVGRRLRRVVLAALAAASLRLSTKTVAATPSATTTTAAIEPMIGPLPRFLGACGSP